MKKVYILLILVTFITIIFLIGYFVFKTDNTVITEESSLNKDETKKTYNESEEKLNKEKSTISIEGKIKSILNNDNKKNEYISSNIKYVNDYYIATWTEENAGGTILLECKELNCKEIFKIGGSPGIDDFRKYGIPDNISIQLLNKYNPSWQNVKDLYNQ